MKVVSRKKYRYLKREHERICEALKDALERSKEYERRWYEDDPPTEQEKSAYKTNKVILRNLNEVTPMKMENALLYGLPQKSTFGDPVEDGDVENQ